MINFNTNPIKTTFSQEDIYSKLGINPIDQEQEIQRNIEKQRVKKMNTQNMIDRTKNISIDEFDAGVEKAKAKGLTNEQATIQAIEYLDGKGIGIQGVDMKMLKDGLQKPSLSQVGTQISSNLRTQEPKESQEPNMAWEVTKGVLSSPFQAFGGVTSGIASGAGGLISLGYDVLGLDELKKINDKQVQKTADLVSEIFSLGLSKTETFNDEQDILTGVGRFGGEIATGGGLLKAGAKGAVKVAPKVVNKVDDLVKAIDKWKPSQYDKALSKMIGHSTKFAAQNVPKAAAETVYYGGIVDGEFVSGSELVAGTLLGVPANQISKIMGKKNASQIKDEAIDLWDNIKVGTKKSEKAGTKSTTLSVQKANAEKGVEGATKVNSLATNIRQKTGRELSDTSPEMVGEDILLALDDVTERMTNAKPDATVSLKGFIKDLEVASGMKKSGKITKEQSKLRNSISNVDVGERNNILKETIDNLTDPLAEGGESVSINRLHRIISSIGNRAYNAAKQGDGQSVEMYNIIRNNLENIFEKNIKNFDEFKLLQKDYSDIMAFKNAFDATTRKFKTGQGKLGISVDSYVLGGGVFDALAKGDTTGLVRGLFQTAIRKVGFSRISPYEQFRRFMSNIKKLENYGQTSSKGLDRALDKGGEMIRRGVETGVQGKTVAPAVVESEILE